MDSFKLIVQSVGMQHGLIRNWIGLRITVWARRSGYAQGGLIKVLEGRVVHVAISYMSKNMFIVATHAVLTFAKKKKKKKKNFTVLKSDGVNMVSHQALHSEFVKFFPELYPL